MRELKFKVWDGQTMSKPFTLSDIYMNYIDPEAGGVVETVVRQYTGLKDKNGVEIYEGDILHVVDISEYETLDYTSSVEWIDYGWILTEPSGTQTPLVCVDSSHDWVNTLTEIEIIGNTYENPPK